jgi:ADP-ribosylglycohydrolase
LIITIQSMLKSRTDKNRFSYQLRNRITWYQRVVPFRQICRSVSGLAKRLSNRVIDDSLSTGIADDPLIRGIVMSIMLQGSTDSTSRWYQQCVEVSHSDPRALHATVLIGHAAQVAQMIEPEMFDGLEVLGMLIESTDESSLSTMLERMHDYLKERRSVAYVARAFGWEAGVPEDLCAIAIISIYAWLRHPQKFRVAVERAALVGGSCGSAAAITGALSGILLGKNAVPANWLDRLSWFPYNNQWREDLIDRMKDWPHGVEDIQRAKGVPSMFFGQLLRNASLGFFRAIQTLLRLPVQLTLFTIKKRRPRRR